ARGMGTKRERAMKLRTWVKVSLGVAMFAAAAMVTAAQTPSAVVRDPAEGPKVKAAAKVPLKPAGAIARSTIHEKEMAISIRELARCGTRLTMSSWTDPHRGIGCGRDFAVAELNEIAKASSGKLQIVVDKTEMQNERTGNKPVHLENVYAILPGNDPK